MLQVFDNLRTNQAKPLPSRSLGSSRLNRGVSRSMPNMAVLQGPPTAPIEFLYVSSANSSTLNMESVETVELPAASPTIVVTNYASPDILYDIGLVNSAVLKPTVAEVYGIESVSSAPMPAEAKPAEVDAPKARSEIESPRRASSMPNMAVRFGELFKSEDSPTKKPADETTASLQNPDILINGRSDVARTDTTTVTAVVHVNLFQKFDYYVDVAMDDWVEGFEDVVEYSKSLSDVYMVTALDKEMLDCERFSAGLAHCRFFFAHKISMGHL
ncbi:hypothetical protein QTP88_025457 [Uroleucon formosanum]